MATTTPPATVPAIDPTTVPTDPSEGLSFLERRKDQQTINQAEAAAALKKHYGGEKLSYEEVLQASMAAGGKQGLVAAGAEIARARPDVDGGAGARSVLGPAAAEAHAGLMNLLAARASGR